MPRWVCHLCPCPHTLALLDHLLPGSCILNDLQYSHWQNMESPARSNRQPRPAPASTQPHSVGTQNQNNPLGYSRIADQEDGLRH